MTPDGKGHVLVDVLVIGNAGDCFCRKRWEKKINIDILG
jgi:hypothetical protein